MPRPITATIHLSALKHNYSIARQYAKKAKVWAVVKANAYGHGLELAKQAFEDADGLALVEVDNAIQLRQMGWDKPILLLEGIFHLEDLPWVYEHQIEVVVHCVEQIELLELYRDAANTNTINVHLKVNGGMNRLGFDPEYIATAYLRLSAIQSVRVVDLMMHFANADDEFNPQLPVAKQLQRFDMARTSLGNVQLDISLSNSAANLLLPSIKNDWVRIGFMLYGGSPNPPKYSAADFGLLPTMTLASELIAIQTIRAGEAVGYGSRFVALQPMRVGVVACGYADGYSRHAIDGTPVLVNGIRTKLVGRVSMDLITVDVTDIPDAKVGSKVTLWGEGLPIDEVAEAAGTVGYELMCGVAKRVRYCVSDA